MAVLLGGASSALLGLGCYLLRERLVRIFTMDPEVLSADLSIFAVMCGTIFTDGVNVSIEGTTRLIPTRKRRRFAALQWQIFACG